MECDRITKYILPAVRASLALRMHEMGYRQQKISEKLGIVQVAVSKYINGRYSKEVFRIKEYIISKGLEGQIISQIESGRTQERIGRSIEELCEKIARSEMSMVS